jgi:hypothetical protein
MTISLYDASVPVFRQMLGSLSTILEKAEAHASARGFDAANLLQARLYPDMLPLTRQVQIACDNAKNGLARIAGVEAPKHEDNEKTIAELRARIAAAMAFIEGVPRERIDGREQADVSIPLRDQTLHMKGQPYLLHWVLPNVFFHVTTAYALLRHNGLEIGKRDFLGKFM